MARKLSEAAVRFVEVCDPGWDHHNKLASRPADALQVGGPARGRSTG